jgi:hypothetical protein
MAEERIMPTKDKQARDFGDKISAPHFKKKTIEYFEKNEPDTWNFAGLLLHLKLSKPQYKMLADGYDKKTGAPNAYQKWIDYASLCLEKRYLVDLSKSNCTGAIFALKNLGYSDNKGIEHTVEIGANLEQVLKGVLVKA